METSSPAIDEVPATTKPLKIIVSEAGQIAALKALVAQSVPILRNPNNFTMKRRRQLAQRLARAIYPFGDTQEPEVLDPDSERTSNDFVTWLEDEE